MHELWNALVFVAVLGILAQAVGPFIPRSWFHADRFPFRSFAWERDGKIYNALGIRKWKDRVPDMSRVLKWMIPKKLQRSTSSVHIDQLVRETCVAESVHTALILVSVWIFQRWRSVEALLFWLLYNLLGNMPFILIQRYNRPRLMKLARKIQAKERVA